MLCDKLESFRAETFGGGIEKVYEKADVDAAIDELKADNEKLRRENEAMRHAISGMFDKLLKMRENYLGGSQKRSPLAKKSSQ